MFQIFAAFRQQVRSISQVESSILPAIKLGCLAILGALLALQKHVIANSTYTQPPQVLQLLKASAHTSIQVMRSWLKI
jgi:hypothetical protein